MQPEPGLLSVGMKASGKQEGQFSRQWHRAAHLNAWTHARAWVLLILLAVGALLVLGPAGGLVALAIEFITWWNCGPIAVRSLHARTAEPEDFPQLHRLMEELAFIADMPKPKLYVSDMGGDMNAAASGRDPEHGVVIVSLAMLEEFTNKDRELRAVLAHEYAHILNRDTAVMALVALAGTLAIMAAYVAHQARVVTAAAHGQPEPGPESVVLAVVAATLIQAAVSRSRESLADREGALLAADPDGLISALTTIHGVPGAYPLLRSNPAAGHLMIHNPFRGGNIIVVAFAGLFATHPPLTRRVGDLLTLRDADGAPGWREPRLYSAV